MDVLEELSQQHASVLNEVNTLQELCRVLENDLRHYEKLLSERSRELWAIEDKMKE